MRAYLDIGAQSARSLIVSQIDDDGIFIDPVLADRKCVGRGSKGFVNLDQAQIDLLSLSNRVVDDLGQASLPQYSVLVRDYAAHSSVREFTVDVRGGTVRPTDIQFLKANIDLAVPDGYYPVHRIPIGYRVNNGELMDTPVGFAADTLSLYVFVVAVANTELHNYQRLLRHANISLRRIVYDGMAHGIAALRESQTMTATVIEFGALNTSVSLWQNGKPVLMKSVPMGMDNLTVALVRDLHCSTREAERLKKSRGFDRGSKPVTFKLNDNKSTGSIASENFFQIIQTELLKILREVQLAAAEPRWPEPMPSYRHKIVLTGGGRNMTGLQKLVHDITKVEVVVARGHQMTDGETAFMGCLGQYYLEDDDLGQAALLADTKISSGSGWWSAIKKIFS